MGVLKSACASLQTYANYSVSASEYMFNSGHIFTALAIFSGVLLPKTNADIPEEGRTGLPKFRDDYIDIQKNIPFLQKITADDLQTNILAVISLPTLASYTLGLTFLKAAEALNYLAYKIGGEDSFIDEPISNAYPYEL